jgi:hercynylcysteine S-oxide lyase
VTDAAEHERWRWWRERRLPAERLYLNSAAVGRSSVATLRATAAHAEREALIGGYVAQAEAGPVLDEGRAALGRLLGVPAAGIAFVESAQVALDALLGAWPLADGDTVALVPSEWGPNLHAFRKRGLRITEIGTFADGVVDLADLERMLAASPPAFVHLTLVTSHRPLVQPVAAAAALCQEAGVPLWVDAAQALGHVDTACGADALYAPSRKWLTGPRGVGILGVASQWWDRLRIDTSELELSAQPAGTSPVWLLESAEAHVSGRVGLCTAVREFTEAGPAAVWQRLASVGRQTREALADLPGWAVVGPPQTASPRTASPQSASPETASPETASPETGSAITALRPLNGQDVAVTQARLLDEHGIVTAACGTARAPREMTGSLLRISPHVDLTPDDLDQLRKALLRLG